MVYTVVEAEYEIKDMLFFDGETIEEWVDKDLRRRAQEEGYEVNDSQDDDDPKDYSKRLWFNLRTDKRADGTAVYKTALISAREIPRIGVE